MNLTLVKVLYKIVLVFDFNVWVRVRVRLWLVVGLRFAALKRVGLGKGRGFVYDMTRVCKVD